MVFVFSQPHFFSIYSYKIFKFKFNVHDFGNYENNYQSESNF